MLCQPLPTTGRVLTDFPHYPLSASSCDYGNWVKNFPLYVHTPPRWNFWSIYAENLDKCLGWIAPTWQNYERFVGATTSETKASISRRCRKEYIPGWSEHSEQLYKQFLENDDKEIGDELLHSLDAVKRAKWMRTLVQMVFQDLSKSRAHGVRTYVRPTASHETWLRSISLIHLEPEKIDLTLLRLKRS